MFSIHLFYKEGSRPSQIYPYCERTNADSGSSNGQTGSRLVSAQLGDVSCPYCHWEKLKEIYATTPGLPEMPPMPVHWGIHPVFSRDGQGRLLRWEAMCGEVKIYPELCLGTRNDTEITCPGCQHFLLLSKKENYR